VWERTAQNKASALIDANGLTIDIDNIGDDASERNPSLAGAIGMVTGVPSVGPASSVCHQLSTT